MPLGAQNCIMSSYDRQRRQKILSQAEGYIELGMPKHALDVIAQERANAIVDGQIHYLGGEALRMLERYDEALDSLQLAAEAMPDNVHVWLALGWCHKRTDALDLAIEALEIALEIDPSEAIIHYNLACYWSLAHNKQFALDYLSRAFEIDSNYRDLVEDEPDFNPLRSDSDFQSLMTVIV